MDSLISSLRCPWRSSNQKLLNITHYTLSYHYTTTAYHNTLYHTTYNTIQHHTSPGSPYDKILPHHTTQHHTIYQSPYHIIPYHTTTYNTIQHDTDVLCFSMVQFTNTHIDTTDYKIMNREYDT
jgi:hypothetical protein